LSASFRERFAMLRDDDSPAIFVAQLDVAAPARDLLEASTLESCENVSR
jgi:hypothetical protein